ncbi:MAG: GIY-YIG nuclease family protein [Candidatus Berkiellales bacterium]
MCQRNPAIYIMANKRNGTLYTGVTSDLIKRVYEHKYSETASFANKYGCKTLIYYEQCEDMLDAIEREKQIKGSSRKKKLALIESMNPEWDDLYEDLSRDWIASTS